MSSRDEAALADMLSFVRRLRSRTEGLTREAFLVDEELQDAVLYRLATLGEAVKRVSKGFRVEHPDVPWRRIAGARDVVMHGYDQVDLEVVWTILERDIPPLLEWLEANVPGKR
jgi:uncharacterized protein with HEPN domain